MSKWTLPAVPGQGTPIAEADLHAYADGQLADARRSQVADFLAQHPEARARVEVWQRQSRQLHGWLDPVLEEPLPLRLPLAPPVRRQRRWQALAAGVAIAAVSAGAAWIARGAADARALQAQARVQAAVDTGFARRAAVAHAVYAADARRPVEVGADQEQALVTWLTKRLGVPVRAPHLASVGYPLVGGRLLPGRQGPVAQFMYASPAAQRLTLYVTGEAAGESPTFHFAQEGPVRVFYWVDGKLGYALSGEVPREELMRISTEVYRQLQAGTRAG